MPAEDSLMARNVMRDFGKYPVDTSELRVSVSSGVVYLTGRLKPLRGYYDDLDLDEVLSAVYKRIRQHSGVRDIIMDVETPNRSRIDTRRKKNITL